jgi:uncharacterized repeat protein (TIGR03803 family)
MLSMGLTAVASFAGSSGASPYGGVIEDSSGNLLGTTSGGGASGAGTVFEVARGSGAITTLASFNGTTGSRPYGGVIEDSGGNLFGTTDEGGVYGTVFEIAKGSGTITTLASFNGTNGSQPYGGVIEDSGGNLFGTTAFGGASNGGTVFELVATAPAIPTGLTATAAGSQSVSISWNSSSGATSYSRQRATSASGTYTQVHIGSATQYFDSSLSPNTTYYYEVDASNDSGSSSYSTAVSATTGAPPSFALIGPTAGTFTAGNTVTIQWTAANVDVAGPTKITLGYDPDATAFDANQHWLEVDGVTAANGTASYSWNTTGVASGTYHLSGYMYDFATGQAV